MPQRLDKVVPNPHLYLDDNALHNKPDMAVIACQIFAKWALIEHELSLLLVRILGAHEHPALAVYSILDSTRLQLLALEAAAKSVLPLDDYHLFQAVLDIADSAQKTRNKLAHWCWAGCKQRPDLLVLADPKMIKERDLRALKLAFQNPSELPDLDAYAAYQFDPSRALSFTKDDLTRAAVELENAYQAVFIFELYLRPYENPFAGLVFKGEHPEDVRKALLDRLTSVPSFRAALDRIRAGHQSKSQTPAKSRGQ